MSKMGSCQEEGGELGIWTSWVWIQSWLLRSVHSVTGFHTLLSLSFSGLNSGKSKKQHNGITRVKLLAQGLPHSRQLSTCRFFYYCGNNRLSHHDLQHDQVFSGFECRQRKNSFKVLFLCFSLTLLGNMFLCGFHCGPRSKSWVSHAKTAGHPKHPSTNWTSSFIHVPLQGR